jgi:hypothetical protein
MPNAAKIITFLPNFGQKKLPWTLLTFIINFHFFFGCNFFINEILKSLKVWNLALREAFSWWESWENLIENVLLVCSALEIFWGSKWASVAAEHPNSRVEKSVLLEKFNKVIRKDDVVESVSVIWLHMWLQKKVEI